MEADSMFNHGLKRARAGDYTGAYFSLRQAAALEGDGARPDTIRLLGKVCVRLGDLKQAEDCFRQALAADPADSSASLCLDTLKRFRRNRRVFGGAAAMALIAAGAAALWYSLQPYPAAVSNRPVIQQVQALPKVSIPEPPPSAPPEAPKIPAEAAAAQPAIPGAQFGERYQEAVDAALRGDLEEALPLLEKLAADTYAREPLAGNVHFWSGRCLFELGITERALDHFQRVLESYPGSPKTAEALLDVGRCYTRLGDPGKARAAWQQLLDGPYPPELKQLSAKFLKR